MIQIRRALLSVSDKTGLVEFGQFLHRNGTELLSTGGTARALREAGIAVVEVSDYTGFPEILDGRVKTLHPKIHGGLLGIRSRRTHAEQLQREGIGSIDIAVVNLYPFAEVAAREDSTYDEVIEQVDIGGPSMVRSAAKNHAFVAVVTDPRDYGWLQQEMEAQEHCIGAATRFILAQKAFALTAAYDSNIAAFFGGRVWSDQGVRATTTQLGAQTTLPLVKVRDLRYGENPHQRAALYRPVGSIPAGVAGADNIHGKELSYNNLLDSDAAWSLVQEFERPAAAVIKHTNPSGVAQSDSLRDAYVLARESDPVSAFGSVVALNRRVDAQVAEEIVSTFVEAVLAPEFDRAAIEVLRQKKNLRLLVMGASDDTLFEHRQISGGFLAQHRDFYRVGRDELTTMTKRAPSSDEMEALLFGWRVVKHVKSNAIVFSDASRTLGIGAGQMSRVDSVVWGAQRSSLALDGSAMASDAFFPFPDGIEKAADFGVRAVVQPGGSVRDAEVIDAADARDIAMVYTGVRHFKH